MSDISGIELAPLRIVAAVHPLRTTQVDITVPAGPTLAEIFEGIQPDPVLRRAAHIYVGDWYVPREHWARVRPKPGMLINVRARIAPQGGGDGKEVMRSVLLIAVAAAAIGFGGPLGGALLGAGSGAFGAAVGQAIIGIGGMLLVNALIPPRQLSNAAEESPTRFIENARNQADPFGVVPDLFGTMKVVPKLGAQPYTEIVGDDQYLNMLFVWGVAPMNIDQSKFKIGETLLSEFDEVQVETNDGYANFADMTLFPNIVNQDGFSILLKAADGFTLRTSSDNADRIGIDLTFLEGLVTVSSDGSRSNRSVTIELEYSVSGANDWQNIPVAGLSKTFPDAWMNSDGTAFNQIKFTGKKTAAVRHGLTFKTPAPGVYDIRIKRTTSDASSDTIRDRVTWAALRTTTVANPLNSPVPLAWTALRIKATDQLNGVVDEFAGYPERVCPDWDAGTETWITRPTRNPASLYRYALQSSALQVPTLDAAIDLDFLAEWHEYNVEQGFEFNQLRDFASSHYDVLADVAAGGRASPQMVDGKWSVVIDKPKTPVSMITPRNSRNFEANKAFVDAPHAIRVEFQNEEQDYRTDEVRIYLDGYDEHNATKFEKADYPGRTKPSLVIKDARFAAAVAIHRPEVFSFTQDMERLVYKRGDVVTIQHDVLLVGIMSARISSLITDIDDNVTGVVLDAPVTVEADTVYGLVIRSVLNAALTAELTLMEAGETDTLSFVNPIPPSAELTGGELVAFGLHGLETDECIILDIDPNADLYDANITAVPYREIVYTIDDGAIPDFDSRITPLARVAAPVILNVRSDETVLTAGAGESLSVHVAVKFRASTDDDLAVIETQIAPSTTDEPYAAAQVDAVTANEVFIGDVRTGDYVNIRLRWLVPGRLPSDWSYVSNHHVIGKSTNPQPLQNLTISTYNGQAFFRWDQPPELDVIFGGEVRFRHSEDVTPLWGNSTSIGQVAQARALFATLPLKTGTYLAQVVDEAGNLSDVVMVSSYQASVLTYAPVDTIDEAPSFSGVKDNTSVDGISLIIGGAGQWDDIPDIDAEPDIDLFGGTSVITTGEYAFASGFDFGSTKSVRLTTRLLAGIYQVNDDIDEWSDPIDDRDDFDGVGAAEADCVVYVSTTTDNPGSPSPNWGSWERLDSMEVRARGCKFKAVLTSYNRDFNIAVTTLSVDAEEI